jgi:hypothetical protein
MSELGSLADVKLSEVLRVFCGGKKTGVLTVQNGSRQGRITIQKGVIVHAITGRLHGREAVLDLFGWRDGHIGFLAEEQNLTPNVSQATEALLEEGQRLGESFHRMQEVLSSDRLVFQWGAGPPAEDARTPLGAVAWRVLRAVDGIREVREVVEASRVPRAEALRILFEYIEAGYVERAEIPKALRVQAQGRFGKEGAEVDERLLLDWKKNLRFGHGVFRVDVRSSGGAHVGLAVGFRAGLGRDVALPRAVLSELAVQEGDEVFVRPVG